VVIGNIRTLSDHDIVCVNSPTARRETTAYIPNKELAKELHEKVFKEVDAPTPYDYRRYLKQKLDEGAQIIKEITLTETWKLQMDKKQLSKEGIEREEEKRKVRLKRALEKITEDRQTGNTNRAFRNLKKITHYH
jgi:cobalamin-dependent methionine synthase I